ncbi:hypothetical protein [Vibrio aerogenes]|uniref:hypothetical protein n=1 Tax=Vibrio aerogenes TaxID=92172 RepID=UPI001587FC91|nr:hypothetical protein [Vibrio aerogenes]
MSTAPELYPVQRLRSDYLIDNIAEVVDIAMIHMYAMDLFDAVTISGCAHYTIVTL